MGLFNRIIIVFGITLGINPVFGQKSGFIVSTDKFIIDGYSAGFEMLQSGDTIFIEGGNRNFLIIKNITGSPGKPITIINSAGTVVIDTDHYFGISVQNCRYIKISGTGDPTTEYGFEIRRVSGGCGIGIGYMSSDFEIDHLSIANCHTAGIFAKTDPECSYKSLRDSFIQYNTIIHHNYIENVGVEGMYIGSTKYFGQVVNCNGKDTLLTPSLLKGVKVFDNTVVSTGWDGIQVSSASEDCEIYGNTILFDSQMEESGQTSGILIGGGTSGNCYNNFIANGKGNGIEIHGLGRINVYNNIILNPGITFKPDDITQFKHGIFVTDTSTSDDSVFYIAHNDIVNPKSDGIRISGLTKTKNVIEGNVIINPGNYDFYESGNTSFKGADAYVMVQNQAANAIIQNNYFEREFDKAGFVSEQLTGADDFHLTNNSPLIDAVYINTSILTDFSGTKRPFGIRSDMGAFEYNGNINSTATVDDIKPEIWLTKNPVSEILEFRLNISLVEDLDLIIFNANGVLVKQQKFMMPDFQGGLLKVGVSDLPGAVYIYKIVVNNNVFTGKFMKH